MFGRIKVVGFVSTVDSFTCDQIIKMFFFTNLDSSKNSNCWSNSFTPLWFPFYFIRGTTLSSPLLRSPPYQLPNGEDRLVTSLRPGDKWPLPRWTQHFSWLSTLTPFSLTPLITNSFYFPGIWNLSLLNSKIQVGEYFYFNFQRFVQNG